MKFNLSSKKIEKTNRTKKYEDDNYEVYWEGMPFIRGLSPDEPSIRKFLDEIKKSTLNSFIENLTGIYACIIYDKKKDIYYVFIDNAGQYNLFKSPNLFSTSYLESIKHNKFKKEDMNPEIISNFIISDSYMGWKTAFIPVEKIKHDEIIIIKGSDVHIEKKILKDIFSIKKLDNKSIIKRFENIVNSLKKANTKIVLDLSGGHDSRMLSTIFVHYGLQFDTSTTGMPNYPDVFLSKQIADILGLNHTIHHHEVTSNTIQQEINDAFIDFDACMNILNWHHGYQYQKLKIKKGYKLNITGHSGEFYKPMFLWSCGDPVPKIAIENLIRKQGGGRRYGTYFSNIPYNIFSKEYKKLSLGYKDRLKSDLLKHYANDKSGKVLAKIYYYYMEAGRTTNAYLIDRYSPLMDRYIIPCGTTLKGGVKNNLYHQFRRLFIRPWNDRFLYERKVTTSLNRKVAKVRVADALNYNASSSFFDQLNGYLKKRVKWAQRNIKKGPKYHPEFYSIVKSLPKSSDLMEILKNENILKSDIKVEDIPNSYMGALYTIAKLIDFINNLS
ncbi:MAG: asparagine synthase-related protein [Promethearchaeia archaeon]